MRTPRERRDSRARNARLNASQARAQRVAAAGIVASGVRAFGLAAVAALVISCGAGDAEAPVGSAEPSCPGLAARSATLVAHISAGKLDGIGGLIRDNVDDAVVRALLRLLLDTLSGLPPGAADALGPALGGVDSAEGHALVSRLIDPLIDGVEADEAALLAIARWVGVCGDRASLEALATWLDDPRARASVTALLGGGTATLDALAAALAAAGDDGRAAFQTLVGNLLTSLALPGFDPAPLRQTLVAAVDLSAEASGTVVALVGLLDALTTTEAGAVDPARIEALAAIAGCGRAVDPDLAVAGWLYDVLRGGEGQEATTLPAVELDPLLDVATGALRGVAASPEGQSALGALAMALLAPDRAAIALPELRALVGSGALQSLGETLTALLAGPCEPPP